MTWVWYTKYFIVRRLKPFVFVRWSKRRPGVATYTKVTNSLREKKKQMKRKGMACKQWINVKTVCNFFNNSVQILTKNIFWFKWFQQTLHRSSNKWQKNGIVDKKIVSKCTLKEKWQINPSTMTLGRNLDSYTTIKLPSNRT